jgi:hypothetical protein
LYQEKSGNGAIENKQTRLGGSAPWHLALDSITVNCVFELTSILQLKEGADLGILHQGRYLRPVLKQIELWRSSKFELSWAVQLFKQFLTSFENELA